MSWIKAKAINSRSGGKVSTLGNSLAEFVGKTCGTLKDCFGASLALWPQPRPRTSVEFSSLSNFFCKTRVGLNGRRRRKASCKLTYFSLLFRELSSIPYCGRIWIWDFLYFLSRFELCAKLCAPSNFHFRLRARENEKLKNRKPNRESNWKLKSLYFWWVMSRWVSRK